jgi:hypothetical protein
VSSPVVRLHVAWLILALPCVALAAPPNRPAPPPRTQPNRVVQPPPTRVVQPPPTRVVQPPPTRVVQPPPTRVVQPPPARSTAPPQGFNFNHDINVRTTPGTTGRPTAAPSIVRRSVTGPGNTIGRAVPTPGPGRAAPNFKRAPFNTTSHGPYQNHPRGPAVQNPRHWSGNWQWNRGVAWQPAQTYWGGGFWGAFALGALADAVLFGSIDDYQDQLSYPSYQVLPDSPGAQLLQNYGLQQTPCGPDNLVVIWGPDNSVICAYPNDTVGPGNYDLDPTTLSLVSESP